MEYSFAMLFDGTFEVVDQEENRVTVRHLETGREIEVVLPQIEKFLASYPLGAVFAGTVAVEEENYVC